MHHQSRHGIHPDCNMYIHPDCNMYKTHTSAPLQSQHAAVTLWSLMYFKSSDTQLLEALLGRCNGLQQGDSRFLLKVRSTRVVDDAHTAMHAVHTVTHPPLCCSVAFSMPPTVCSVAQPTRPRLHAVYDHIMITTLLLLHYIAVQLHTVAITLHHHRCTRRCPMTPPGS